MKTLAEYGTDIFERGLDLGAQYLAPKQKEAAKPKASTAPTPAFNWKPWAIGGGALVVVVVIFLALKGRRGTA